jgi:hypothetical protein
MYLTQRKWHHVPAQFQRLSAFAIIAVLAFSVGWAVGTYGPAAYTFLTTNRNAAQTAAPASGLRIPNSVAQAPAVAPAVVAPQTWPNVPVSGMGSVYDSGHFGGVTAPAAAPAVVAPQTWPNVPVSGMGSVYDSGHFGGVTAPAVAPDQAQQGVMNYVRAHDAVEGQRAPRGSQGDLITNCRACLNEVFSARPASLGASDSGIMDDSRQQGLR